MDIRIDGGEELELTGEADDVTVTNLTNQKPLMSSPPPSISPLIVPVKASYGQISQSNGEEEFDWVAVERGADVVITDKAPEIDEVEEAFSALQLLYDSFHLFQTDPSVQRMVMSLASDRAVWDAVMNNEVVRELITNAERSEEDSGPAATFIRRLFKRSAIKIIDAMERVTKYVTDLFNVVVPGDETVVLATGPAPVMEKLQMTVLLAVVVLLFVLVARVTRAR
ncbi:unnamed protein product [Arabis nemorensis]|uniref:Transmembrane protein n=1 Tax=Arabis nemorensis TaxID=586526 RepID=A0A565CJ34_9BRAS|nr:unnamed protein product [Arabis nemorensis]